MALFVLPGGSAGIFPEFAGKPMMTKGFTASWVPELHTGTRFPLLSHGTSM
jgi:hypothetical protein